MSRQEGYVLISVLFALSVIAIIGLNLSQESGLDTRLASNQLSKTKAQLTAEAGRAHLLNRATLLNCEGYTDITSESFGSGVYSATITPTSGSPVSIAINASMDSGSYAELINNNQTIYQPAQPVLPITPAQGNGGDTHINNSRWFLASDKNYSNNNSIMFGNNILSTKQYALLLFDLTRFTVPVKLLSAKLKINTTSVFTKDETAFASAHHMTTEWEPSTVTFNKSNGSQNWTWADSYSPVAASILQLPNKDTGAMEMNIIDLAQKWLDGTTPNYGLTLIANNKLDAMSFTSANSSEANLHPTLEIFYTCECGLNCRN